MTDTWAAKVLAGVPRWTIDEGRGAFLSEAEVLAAIDKLADGGGLVDRATAALEGVTDGPWAVEYKDGITRLLMGNEVAMCDEKYYPWTPENDKDWHFIAFARQWVPEAADRIAALTAQVAELEVMSDAKPDWENFSKAVLADWPTGDLEGSVLFDLSLQYGMIKEVPGGYNSDHHFDNDGICPEEGDPWYEYTFGGEAGPGLYSIAEMKNTIAALTTQNQTWQRNSRETFDAMVAMRNSINEHLPMPSLESDLLQGPENSVFCAAVADAVVQHVAALTAERDRQYDENVHRIAEQAKAKAEAAALRAKLARIASAWPIVRDADCSGGTLASAMDEIEAAISDGAADGGKHE